MKASYILILLILYLLVINTAAKTAQLDFENKLDTIIIEKPEKVITYDFGNNHLMAKSDSNLNINKYWVVNVVPSIIVDNSWNTSVAVNNQTLKKPDNTYARSNMFLNEYILEDIITKVTTYTDNSTNAIFQRYNFIPLTDNKESTIDISFSFNFDLGINEKDIIIKYTNSNNGYYFIAYNSNNDIAGLFSSNYLPYKYEINNQNLKIFFHFKSSELKDFYVTLSGGFSKENEENIIKSILTSWDIPYKNALNRANWIDNLFNSDNKLYDQMFSACLDCALSNFKIDNNVHFKAFYAGVRYKEPARTYFRDSYWTIQSILPFKPELVRDQIIALAKGIHDDGACGSGVKFDGSDWWSNHYDSPSFFVMMIYDYIIWTGDLSVLTEKTKGKTKDNGMGSVEFSKEKNVWEKAKKTMEWLYKTDKNKNYLIQVTY